MADLRLLKLLLPDYLMDYFSAPQKDVFIQFENEIDKSNCFEYSGNFEKTEVGFCVCKTRKKFLTNHKQFDEHSLMNY